MCTEETSLEAPLAFTCTHRDAFWVQLPYTGIRGGFTGKTMGVSALLHTPSAQGICPFCSHCRCTVLHAQTLRATVLGQSLPDPSSRLLASLPPSETSSFSSVPQSLSCTSLGPKPTDVSGSFKSCFPALPANTFNPQSLTTSYGDGMVNARLQTLSHLPKITP